VRGTPNVKRATMRAARAPPLGAIHAPPGTTRARTRPPTRAAPRRYRTPRARSSSLARAWQCRGARWRGGAGRAGGREGDVARPAPLAGGRPAPLPAARAACPRCSPTPSRAAPLPPARAAAVRRRGGIGRNGSSASRRAGRARACSAPAPPGADREANVSRTCRRRGGSRARGGGEARRGRVGWRTWHARRRVWVSLSDASAATEPTTRRSSPCAAPPEASSCSALSSALRTRWSCAARSAARAPSVRRPRARGAGPL